MATADVTAWNAKILDINNNPISLQHIITDLTSPVLEREFDTEKRAGEMGTVSRPIGFNEVETSFTIKKPQKDLSKALLEALGSPDKTIVVQAAAVVDTGTGRESYTWACTGHISSYPLGDLSSEGLEAEVSMMVNKLDVNFGADFTMSYDPENFLYSVNGVNLWEDIANLIN